MIKYLFCISFLLIQISCTSQKTTPKEVIPSEDITPKTLEVPEGEIVKIEKSEEEWKKELSESEYYVIRKKGTERAFTGDLLKNKDKGVYTCRACQLPLFGSETKFESGTGWPSFYAPFKSEFVAEEVDDSYGMKRVEVLCARCNGHLGHVFEDGPDPTGLRYCINAVSLDFVKKEN